MGRRRTGPAARLLLGGIAVLAVWGVGPALPRAQDAETPPAAAEVRPSETLVIDFQAVVRESMAAESVQAQVSGLREAYQAEFGQIEEDLRAIEQELTEARDQLPEAEFLERRRQFERRITEAQRRAQERRAVLDRALDEAMGQVRSTLIDIVAEIAGDRGARIVLNKTQTVLSDRTLDITGEALDRLDARLPTVEVDLPAEGPSPGDDSG
jgi:Skp family chaperone for outer membrane proteins